VFIALHPSFVLPITNNGEHRVWLCNLNIVTNGILGLCGIYRDYAGFKWGITRNSGAITGDSGRSWEEHRLDELGQARAAAGNLSCSGLRLSSSDEHWARSSLVAQAFSLCAFVGRVTGLKTVHVVFALKSQLVRSILRANGAKDTSPGQRPGNLYHSMIPRPAGAEVNRSVPPMTFIEFDLVRFSRWIPRAPSGRAKNDGARGPRALPWADMRRRFQRRSEMLDFVSS
jgi:hypothetical protein